MLIATNARIPAPHEGGLHGRPAEHAERDKHQISEGSPSESVQKKAAAPTNGAAHVQFTTSLVDRPGLNVDRGHVLKIFILLEKKHKPKITTRECVVYNWFQCGLRVVPTWSRKSKYCLELVPVWSQYGLNVDPKI